MMHLEYVLERLQKKISIIYVQKTFAVHIVNQMVSVSKKTKEELKTNFEFVDNDKSDKHVQS